MFVVGVCKNSLRLLKGISCYSTKSLNIVFFGSDGISLPTLQLLYNDSVFEDGLINKLEVICTGDKRSKRGNGVIESPIRHFCEKYDVPYTQLPRFENHCMKEWNPPDSVKNKEYTLCVVASFGYFIPPHVISCFRDGGINMHPSLLPKYRGAAPIQHALLNNEKETGVSIITLSDKVIDSGKCLYQKKIEIDPLVHYPELAASLAREGGIGVMETLYNLENISPWIQNENEVTMAPKIKKEMSYVDFSSKCAMDVWNLYRAINYDYPLRCMWRDRLVFLRSLQPVMKSDKGIVRASEYSPGSVVYCKEKKKLLIRCKDEWIYCNEIQIMPQSKSVMASVVGNEFINGDQTFDKFNGYYVV